MTSTAFDIAAYTRDFARVMRDAFGERLVYIGLQGSYARGDANENSDVDMMVVLSSLDLDALDAYRNALDSLAYDVQKCGFICAKDDIAHWNKPELCQLLFTTRDVFGSLSALVPPYDRSDVIAYVKLGAGNLYHALCHRYVYGGAENAVASLNGMVKEAFFLAQGAHYLDSGDYCLDKRALLGIARGTDKDVMRLVLGQRGAPKQDLALLMRYCQEIISRY